MTRSKLSRSNSNVAASPVITSTFLSPLLSASARIYAFCRFEFENPTICDLGNFSAR